MSSTEEVLALLVDPVTIIVGGAVVLLLAASVKEIATKQGGEEQTLKPFRHADSFTTA